jgi:hypothetical protein
MVKTKYQCEVCNEHFNSLEGAIEHEKIPVTNDALPKGLVLKGVRGVYYVLEKVSKVNEDHIALYDALEVDFFYLERKDALGVKPKYDLYTSHGNISLDVSKFIATDEELARVKEMIKQAQNDPNYLRKEQYLRKVNLEDLTNKLS